jgi:hypothetical protein
MVNSELTGQAKVRWEIVCWALMPGRFMHDDWWRYFGIAAWRSAYQCDSRRARFIDLYIRRQLPENFTAHFHSVNEIQQSLYNISGRWPLFMTALGVMQSGCVDYLLRREYRQQLASVMNRDQIDQLVGLWRDGNSDPQLAPDVLLDSLQSLGYFSLFTLMQDDPLWSVVQLQLPRRDISQENISRVEVSTIRSKVHRLERFL